MVRIKHRWLLVQILYPVSSDSKQKPQQVTHHSVKPQTAAEGSSLLAAPSPTISLHAPTPDPINIPAILRLLRTQISTLFGDYGSGICNNGLAIKYFSNATSTFIVRCERQAFRLVWAAVTFIKSLSIPEGRGKQTELPCVMQVLRVSGTIKKCEQELIRRAKALCGRVKGLEMAADAGAGADGVVDVSDNEDEGLTPIGVEDEVDEG